LSPSKGLFGNFGREAANRMGSPIKAESYDLGQSQWNDFETVTVRVGLLRLADDIRGAEH